VISSDIKYAKRVRGFNRDACFYKKVLSLINLRIIFDLELEQTMKKSLLFLIILVFAGCASTRNRGHFADNTFFSDHPKLKVRILKNVVKQKKGSKQGPAFTRTQYTYLTESRDLVGITFWRFVEASNWEWQSTDEQIMSVIGLVPLETTSINDRTWVKFIETSNEKYLAFGYFKRMGDNLVAVFSISPAKPFKNEIESFKKTRIMDEPFKRLVNKAFDYNERLFAID
jgi:hypothetical protein